MAAQPVPRVRAHARSRITLLHLMSLELGLAALAVVTCLAFCVTQAPVLIAKAHASGDFFQARTAAMAMAERIAMTGELPDQAEPQIGLRPAEAASSADGNLLWLCGDRLPPAGWLAPPPLSAAASAPSFSVCREARARW